jgi:hypothetical protein
MADLDPQTLANMEIALEAACKYLPAWQDQGWARAHVSGKICEGAMAGDATLDELIDAGLAAVTELCATHGA